MTISTDQPAHATYRSVRACAVFLGIVVASGVVASPVAQASSRSGLSATAVCAKVSTASVSGIVGHSLPAPTAATTDLKATTQNDEISSVQTSCTYGAGTLAALPKDVVLDYAVTSRPLTSADLKKGLSQAKEIKMTIVPYLGLGILAYYYSFAVGGTAIRGISAIAGVKEYGAFVYSTATSKSKLAALVRLAEKL